MDITETLSKNFPGLLLGLTFLLGLLISQDWKQTKVVIAQLMLAVEKISHEQQAGPEKLQMVITAVVLQLPWRVVLYLRLLAWLKRQTFDQLVAELAQEVYNQMKQIQLVLPVQ